jgi:hypothetical protein
MVKELLEEHVFPVGWSEIALASWLKYPHPARPDVLSVDVLDRHYNHETGTLTAYRLSVICGGLPAWMCAVTGGCTVLFLEKSVINPRTGFMRLESENLTSNTYWQMKEVCTYTRDELNPETRTKFVQEMKISVSVPVWGVGEQIERIVAEGALKNALLGHKIMMESVGQIPHVTRGVVFEPRAAANKY